MVFTVSPDGDQIVDFQWLHHPTMGTCMGRCRYPKAWMTDIWIIYGSYMVNLWLIIDIWLIYITIWLNFITTEACSPETWNRWFFNGNHCLPNGRSIQVSDFFYFTQIHIPSGKLIWLLKIIILNGKNHFFHGNFPWLCSSTRGCIYIYVYIQRERERKREILCVCVRVMIDELIYRFRC